MSPTLLEAFEAHCADRPDRVVLRFLVTGDVDGEIRELPLGECRLRALHVADRLRERGLRVGDRALLVYDDGLALAQALLGCFYAGVVAVPTYPPAPAVARRMLPRIRAIAVDAGASCVLATGDIEGLARPLCEADDRLRTLDWIATDRVDVSGPPPRERPIPDREAIAYLQYTSGSTGSPKGVVITHGDLAFAIHDLLARPLYRAERPHGVSWLPTSHDLGLVWGLLTPLMSAWPGTLMTPTAFLERPARWVEAISALGGTISAAPNFAFGLCARKVTDEVVATLDLSCLDQVVITAEPIRAATVDAFVRRFGPAGFRPGALTPGYGLAETVLQVAMAPAGAGPPVVRSLSRARLEEGRAVAVDPASPDAMTVCSCGPRDDRFLVVDPETRRPLPDLVVGEVWVAERVVASGYWGDPEATRRRFAAELADGAGAGRYLATGDLAFTDPAQLYITGRIEDRIVVEGRNLYPSDIEAEVEAAHPAVRRNCVAAFALEGDETEGIGIVCEVEPRLVDGGDLEAVLRAITARIGGTFRVAPARLALIGPRRIDKTSSGKIRRRSVRAALLGGALETLAGSDRATAADGPSGAPIDLRSPGVLESTLWRLVRREVGLDGPPEPPLETPFQELGLGSAAAASLGGELSRALGRPLPATLLFEHPTIAALASFLRDPRSPDETASEFDRVVGEILGDGGP